ncbi:MAG: M20/M25/M40 family metallo-hydrolase [Nocardioides sp.]|nr:M20/M25/M40 family metallo-hydrolase [Nocardioides sp.]
MTDQDVVALLEDLVRIESVNPGLAPGGSGESEVAAYVVQWAAAAGLRVEIVEPTPGRPNVLVRGGHATGGRRLMLCGHLDTVGLAGMDDPLTPRVEGDRLYARGAYDMKAGLAAALVTCREAEVAGVRGEVLVAAVADEEHASVGVREVLAHLTDVPIDAAVVGEPTELAIGTGHRGFVWTEVTVTGVAAHGSRPHLGVDAILKAGPLLVEFAELDKSLAARPHPFLGPGNLHGSLVAGGTEESTFPDRCAFTVERRTLPGETTASVESDVEALLERCRAADSDLIVAARTVLSRDPFLTPPGAGIVPTLRAASERVTGTAAEAVPLSYWADSAFLAAAGIPTVLYGPSGDGAHADVEWVSLQSTRTCAEVLTHAALDFCS